jgi:hypothetical protein
MLNTIYAEGALRKFLVARAMGAPEEELKALASAAAAEGERDCAIGSDRQPADSESSGVVIEFDRARLLRLTTARLSTPFAL